MPNIIFFKFLENSFSLPYYYADRADPSMTCFRSAPTLLLKWILVIIYLNLWIFRRTINNKCCLWHKTNMTLWFTMITSVLWKFKFKFNMVGQYFIQSGQTKFKMKMVLWKLVKMYGIFPKGVLTGTTASSPRGDW